jgi:hypothetical protein
VQFDVAFCGKYSCHDKGFFRWYVVVLVFCFITDEVLALEVGTSNLEVVGIL